MSRKVLFFLKIKPEEYPRTNDELSRDTKPGESDIISIVTNHLKKGGYKPYPNSIKYVFKEGQLFIEGTAYTVENNRNIQYLVRRLKRRAIHKVHHNS